MTLYRLADFYTLFYFRYVENNRSRDDQYWQHHFMDRSVVSWEGFSFEEICLRHLPHIKQALGIAGIATESSALRFIPVKGNETKGTQVDLVIKRVDKIVHLVEMKFSDHPYTISKEYEEKLKFRRNLFMEITGIKRGVVITFITPEGVSQGLHSSVVHSQLTSRHLFADLL